MNSSAVCELFMSSILLDSFLSSSAITLNNGCDENNQEKQINMKGGNRIKNLSCPASLGLPNMG